MSAKASEFIDEVLTASTEERAFLAQLREVASRVNVYRPSEEEPIRAVFAFLASTADVLPEDVPKQVGYRVDALCPLLREPDAWSARDHRLFAVIHHPGWWDDKASYFFRWAAERIRARPGEDVYGALCAELAARGLEATSIRRYSLWETGDFDYHIAGNLAYFTDEAMLAEFAAICYRSAKQRAWLLARAQV